MESLADATPATAKPRRSYRRRNRFSACMSVSMSPAMRDEVEAVAEYDNVSAADVIRTALAAELPRMRERQRNRRRRGSRS